MAIKLKLTEATTRSQLHLLTEIKLDDVLHSLGSKADLKKIYQMEIQFLEKYKDAVRSFTPEQINERVKNRVTDLAKFIHMATPNDVDENQKGISAIWIKNQCLSNFSIYEDVIHGHDENNFSHFIERFFQVQRFIPVEYRDLMKIPNGEVLKKIVADAQPAYKEYTDQKAYKDASLGTEVIYEDNEFKIFIPNNKGAACELGKGTDWCTAAPGLDYYEEYHKPDDPLFIIFVKKADGVEKFQFHYGTAQFMTAADTPITEWPNGIQLFKKIHRILVNTVGDRFPFLKNSMIETDIGVSTRSEDYTSDCEECPSYLLIRYNDILSGTPYGGEHPAKVKVYYEGGSYEFLFEWVAIKSNPPIKPQHPLKVFVSLVNGKPVLTTAYWYMRGTDRTYEIATFQDNRGIKLDSGNIYRYLIDQGFEWKNTEELEKNRDEVWQQNGGEFYRLNIQRNPDEYAQSLFDAYVPEHVKEEIVEKLADRLPSEEESS